MKQTLHIGDKFIKRGIGAQAKIEQIKPVIVRKGRTEILSYRYRLSGRNEFLSADEIRRQYDQVSERDTAAA